MKDKVIQFFEEYWDKIVETHGIFKHESSYLSFQILEEYYVIKKSDVKQYEGHFVLKTHGIYGDEIQDVKKIGEDTEICGIKMKDIDWHSHFNIEQEE